MDWMSAAVYILTFRFAEARAVFKAHREYGIMAHGADKEQTKLYLQNWCMDAKVTGIYSKWIVLQSLLKGEQIFKFIIEDDFYKI